MSNSGKRVAWVTGGGSGIGEAAAEALATDGWIVVVSGRRKDALEGVVSDELWPLPTYQEMLFIK